MKKLLLSSFIATALTVANAATFTITVDDFDGLNTLGSGNNNLNVTKSENSLQLNFGPGSSSLGYDAYGTGTSTFGQSGEWFDGSYVKIWKFRQPAKAGLQNYQQYRCRCQIEEYFV